MRVLVVVFVLVALVLVVLVPVMLPRRSRAPRRPPDWDPDARLPVEPTDEPPPPGSRPDRERRDRS